MNINDLTIGQLKEIQALLLKTDAHEKSHPWKVGANYFIRTITHHFTGKLVAVHEHELVLVDAAWIADGGRFAEAVREGTFSEVEPFPDNEQVIIGRGSILDAVTVTFPLPRSQK